MKKFILLFCVIVFSITKVWSQETERKLNEAGLKLKTETIISEENLAILLNYKYDDYREYKTNSTIIIKRGPEIELISIMEMQKMGKVFPQELINVKLEISKNIYTSKAIPVVDIGYNLTEVKQPK